MGQLSTNGGFSVLVWNPISLPISVTCSFFMRSGSGFSLYLFCPGTGWSFSVMEFHEHPTNVVSRIVRPVLGSQASINDTLHWETIQHFHFNLVRTDRNCVNWSTSLEFEWYVMILSHFTGVWCSLTCFGPMPMPTSIRCHFLPLSTGCEGRLWLDGLDVGLVGWEHWHLRRLDGIFFRVVICCDNFLGNTSIYII